MKDLFDSLNEHVKDRFSSPLAGAFIFSWLLWNYKILFILFSDVKPWVKFGFISDHVWTSPIVTLVHVLIGPAITAVLYILAYPFPARWVWAYNAMHKRKSELKRQEVEEETPITKEEADRLRASFRKQLDVMQIENRQLSNAIAEYRSAQQNIDDAVRVHQEAAIQSQAEVKRLTLELDAKIQNSAGADAKISALEGQVISLESNFENANNASLQNHNNFIEEQRKSRLLQEQLQMFAHTLFPGQKIDFSDMPSPVLLAMLQKWQLSNDNRYK